MTPSRGIVSVVVLAGALAASTCLTFVSMREHGISGARQEIARLGLEDATRRVAESVRNASVLREAADVVQKAGGNAERLSEALKAADVTTIASTIHVGRKGRVAIEPIKAGYCPPSEPRLVRSADGRFSRVFEAACAGYLVTVSMPEDCPFLAAEAFGDALVVLDLILLLLLVVTLPTVRQTFSENVQSLRTLFGSTARAGSHRASWRRTFSNPLALVGFAVFVLLLAVFWFVSTVQATRAANDTLKTAAEDIDNELRDCVDSLLFFQGDAICRHYGSPEKATADELGEIMDRYGLDELNVVDGKGIVIRGALADVGYDMASNPKTREFNCLLDGKTKTFSQRFRAPVENPGGVKRKYAGVAFDPPAHGYLQLGLSETRLKTRLDYFIEGLAEAWHVGDTGFFVIARAETGEIVSSGRDFGDGKTLAAIGFDTGRADATPFESFEMTLAGVPCLCRSGIVNRYHRYVAAIPLDEVHGGTRRIVASAALVLLAVLLVVVAFMTRLSDLVQSLKSYIAKDREQRERDLAVARTIQLSSLPVSFPDGARFKIFASMDAAREVGGDFYDFMELKSGKWLVLVADVSGKGVPAAMFMMKAKAIVRACVVEFPELSAAIAAANMRLAEQNDAEMFVTAWIGLFDPASGEVEYVCAGHNPPLVKRANGTVEWIRTRCGIALAALDVARYRTARLVLAPGDSLFLYTDGVTEAMNAAGELYGEERLERTLARAGEWFVADVKADVAAFVGGAEPSDDLTMLALGVK